VFKRRSASLNASPSAPDSSWGSAARARDDQESSATVSCGSCGRGRSRTGRAVRATACRSLRSDRFATRAASVLIGDVACSTVSVCCVLRTSPVTAFMTAYSIAWPHRPNVGRAFAKDGKPGCPSDAHDAGQRRGVLHAVSQHDRAPEACGRSARRSSFSVANQHPEARIHGVRANRLSRRRHHRIPPAYRVDGNAISTRARIVS